MLKGLTSTWKNGCNAKTLTFSEYIIIDNKKIPVKAVLKDDCYNNGNFIGTFIFKEISFEVENNIDFKQKEFEYYKVVNGETIKFGTFITTEITDNDTTELVKVVGMDFGLKTQVEYMSSLDYSSGLITLLDVWNECCELSGLTSGITDFTNSDFIVESDQFTGTGATIRDVFVAIAQSSCSFVKVMNDDKIYLIFNEYESNKKDGKTLIIDNSVYNTNLKLQLYGKSTQETRSGKNLLNYIDNLISNANGLTNTINPDGSITTTGKPARNYVTIIKSIAMTDLLEDKQVYTISNEKPGKIYVQVNAMKNDGTYTYYNSYNGKTSFTVDKSLYKSYTVVIQTATMYTWGDSSLTITNKYMLCKGTDTVFEKYGASPSPDYPSEIENIKGKNLINPNLPVGSETKDGITLTNNGDSTYTVKGTATKATGIDLITQNVIKLKGGTYYTNSIEVLSGTMDGHITVSVKGKDDVTKFNYLNLGSTFKAQTKKTEEDLTIVRYNYYIESGKTVAFTFRVQLEEGSVATRYVPYGNTQIVETGKNLWKPFANETRSGITITQNADGSILLNGTATNDVFLKIALNKSFNETMTLGYNYKNGSISNANIYVRTRNADSKLVHNMSLSSLSKKGIGALTMNAEISYQDITVQKGTTLSNVLLEIMLLKGTYNETNLPDYEPYTEEVVNIDLKGNELCSLPNGTKDELIVKDGRAKILKRIGKVVLDGSDDESWTKRNDGDGISTISFNYNISNIGKTNQMNNRFQNGTSSIDGIECLGIPSQLIQIYMQIKRNRLSTLDVTGFKAWLQANPVVLQYELKEPYEIDLGEVATLKTFNGTSIITNSEDAEMSIKYSIINEVIEDYTDLDDKRDTKPITCVRLGMSQIVGENLDLKDDELVKKYGEHWLIINDNPFAYTQKKREELIYAILDKIKGFGYSAFSAKTSFKPYLTCGDIIKFKNKNGELINSILLRYEHNYDEITLEAPSETSATVNYVYPANTIDLYKKAEAKVDKEANNITLLTEQTKTLRENLESDYYNKTNINELLQTAESGITNTFSEAGGNNIFRNTGLWFKADTANIQNLYNESFIYCTYNSDAVNKSLTNVYPSSTSVTSYIRSEELMEINSAYEYSLDVPELTYKHGDTTLSYKTSLLELTSNREFQLENGEILKHELSAGSSTIKFKKNTAYVMLLLENQNFSRNILVGDDLNGKTIYSSLPDNFYETLNEQAVTTSMFVKTSTSNAIGVHTQLSKGLFNVGCNTISNFEQSIMPMIDFYVKNDITTVNEKSLTMSDTFGTVTEIDKNNLAYPYLKIGIDTNLEIADAKTTLKELSIQIKTSDNLYEFWEGEIVRNSNDEAANNNSMLLLNGEVYQEQEVPNGNYAVSFMYQKLNELANASVLINDKEYQLDSTELKQFYTGEQNNETKEYITQPVEVTTNHIRITFKCDVDNAVEIYDLMCNKGIVKLAYSQNENETTTETVNISKGITITSTNMETIFKANANGIKILTLQNATIAYFTDKGLSTKELIVEDEAQICRTLMQNVGDQTWFTRM